jgi:hypothetical protein
VIRSLACLTAVACLVTASPVSAVIRPQKGMAGVTLDMTKAQVKGVLGKPSVRHGKNDFGPFTRYRYGKLEVFFQGDQNVTSIGTTGRSERTVRGVGVGSSESDVRMKVGHARCHTYFGYRTCHVGDFTPGKRVTDFSIRSGRVTRVLVGYVID